MTIASDSEVIVLSSTNSCGYNRFNRYNIVAYDLKHTRFLPYIKIHRNPFNVYDFISRFKVIKVDFNDSRKTYISKSYVYPGIKSLVQF